MGDQKYVKCVVAFSDAQKTDVDRAKQIFTDVSGLDVSRSQFLTFLARNYTKENTSGPNN